MKLRRDEIDACILNVNRQNKTLPYIECISFAFASLATLVPNWLCTRKAEIFNSYGSNKCWAIEYIDYR